MVATLGEGAAFDWRIGKARYSGPGDLVIGDRQNMPG
jgi:hypothetical protein